MGEPQEGDLRVWHVPQIPCPAFRVDVKDVDEAVVLLDVLADYDAFQLEHRIKPDYCNAGGIEVYEAGEWCDFDLDWHLSEADHAKAASDG